MTTPLEWDDAKSERCRVERGFSFAIVEGFDFALAATIVDDRKDYGEVRFRSAGLIDGEPYMVVWNPRGSAVRVISVRRMHKEEFDRVQRKS